MKIEEISKISMTSQYLIVEVISDESIFNMIAPDIKFKRFSVVKTGHRQVMRYVYGIAIGEDVYFKGKKLKGLPDLGQFISEWITPGRQINTVRNGQKSIHIVYSGKKNIGAIEVGQKFHVDASLGYINFIGTDPIKSQTLYGNANVAFVKIGDDDLIAAAYFDSNTNFLEPIQMPIRATLIDNFLKHSH